MYQETFTLNNGVKMPKIGYGVWMIDNEDSVNLVKQAIEVGYRHIDTAEAYGNEEGVGRGVKASGVPREEIFITSKVQGNIKDYETAVAAIDESLEKLQSDYIDLMIIHSPRPWKEFQTDEPYYEENLAVWKALEEAYEAGKVRAIGLSNFEVSDMQNILDNAKVKPMINQVLAHVGQTPFEVIEFAQANDIVVEAYSPIAHGAMLNNPEITAIADKYDVSIAQLAIRYLLQLDLAPLPKTENVDHMKNNADVDFVITDEDMETLKKVGKISYGDDENQPVFKRVTNK